MRRYADRRARAVLAAHATRLQSAILRVHDVNGPRGGNDKRCTLSLQGVRLKKVVVQATDASFYSGVDRVMKKARETLDRAVDRTRSRRTTVATPSDAFRTGAVALRAGTT
jgi:hypothetical protein